MPQIRTPWDRKPGPDRVDPRPAPNVVANMDTEASPTYSGSEAAPDPRPAPKVVFEARITRDGRVVLPSESALSSTTSALRRMRDRGGAASQPAGDLLGTLLSLVRAELHDAVRAALAEQRDQAPEDTGNLTASELAERLKVHTETVRRWSRHPGFPLKRVGPHAVRFDLNAVLAWRRTGT